MSSFYYKWVFSPTTGDVSLISNEEGHPLDIMTHRELEAGRPEPDLIRGYAIKHPKGYKIMDEDDKEIDDPFTLTKIRKAIL